MILTYRFRLKDKHVAELNRQARAVNVVWNYCNETQQKASRAGRSPLRARDLVKLTAGSSTHLDIHSHTVQMTCRQYASSRSVRNRNWLKFRGRKSLGWVPFNQGHVARIGGKRFRFRGRLYECMHEREMPPDAVILGGSFSQDARGRWYLNCPVEVSSIHCASNTSAVGIDLGLDRLGILSTGETVAAPRHYRLAEKRLASASRANKQRLVRSIAAHVANQRRDHLHKVSRALTLAHDLIFVGDVSSEKLARTRMAKSVYDAGWSTFRSMLSYKAIRHGGRMIEVNERMTSQLCSNCGVVGGPKGIAQLGIREWKCGGCGATHDRDVNAALNILARGMASLAEGAAKERSIQ